MTDKEREPFGTCDECGRDIFTEDEGWICNSCPECYERWLNECYKQSLTAKPEPIIGATDLSNEPTP